jgi:hypothetical protein
MGFEIPVAVCIEIIVFWDVTPCNLVGRYRYSRGTCSPHLQGMLCFLYPEDEVSILI